MYEIKGLSFTVFDFETTGLDPEKDKVIEMAAIRVVDGKVVSEFSTLVKNGPVIPKITEITGITNEELENAMDEDTAFRILNRLIGDSVLIAHNAAFDLSFLHFSMMRIAGKTFTNDFFDTLTISRDRHYYPHKLEDMCRRYEVSLEGAHRALNDVHGCWELFSKFDAEDSVYPWTNKLGYLNKYGPNKWYPEHAITFGMDNKYEPRESA